MQVMKMMMALLAPADGIIHFRLSEGSALAAGDLVANLDLDDPAASQVCCMVLQQQHFSHSTRVTLIFIIYC